MEKINTRQEYDKVKERVEKLISEATTFGLLEPDMDNEYTRQIASLSSLMANYEDEYLKILPLREKSPLIRCIEDYYYTHNLHRKDVAKMLGINESVFSQIMNGKRHISLDIAKKLYTQLGIDPAIILKFA